MVQIEQEEMGRIAPFFEGIQETLIWSCLQGQMGRAWADHGATPGCARIITGDFAFFAGDSGRPGARALVEQLPEEHQCLLLYPKDEGWRQLIRQVYPGAEETTRYAFHKEPGAFHKRELEDAVAKLPPQYQLVSITAKWVPKLLLEEWSRDLCSLFESPEDYARRGIGCLILDEGKPVCGASSYTVYNGGIEIEIDTRESHRRQGLAQICASRLILDCLERGLYPSWDAANRTSFRLARRLGYRPAEAYQVYQYRTE